MAADLISLFLMWYISQKTFSMSYYKRKYEFRRKLASEWAFLDCCYSFKSRRDPLLINCRHFCIEHLCKKEVIKYLHNLY